VLGARQIDSVGQGDTRPAPRRIREQPASLRDPWRVGALPLVAPVLDRLDLGRIVDRGAPMGADPG
jgi:hypothetical protein